MIDTAIPYSNRQGGNKKKIIAVLVGVIIIIVVLAGAILMFQQPKKTEEQPQAPIIENKEPTPTEKPQIDKNSVKVQVLNGTGTPGQASSVVEALKIAGYNSDNIKTDNAKEFDDIITTIAAKDGFDDIASDIKDALKTTFDEITIDSTNLDSDSEFDIIITTGGKKFEEVIPTTTTTGSPTQAVTPSPTPTSTPTPTP